MKTQTIVTFKNPNADEMFNGQPLRFVVKEVNGDRCFIEPVTSSLYYLPITLAMVEDLEEVKGD